MTHLIFEGAELTGKSFIASQVYNYLETKYHQGPNRLDGCYWFNCDVGVFGSDQGKKIISSYLKMLVALKGNNIILEKFQISDQVYNELYRNQKIKYGCAEKKLKKLGYKIIFLTFPEDETIIKKRLADRLNLYPHYARIAKEPAFYIKQQKLYREYLRSSQLEYLEIEVANLPDNTAVDKILKFIGE